MTDRRTYEADRINIKNADDFATAFEVSRETLTRLEIYADCLREWNRAINLVSPTTIEHLWQRHFADSAQLLAYATDSRNFADLGSGAGFPGLTLAILLSEHNDVNVQLIESNGKKCAFLRHIARQTGTPVEIVEARIETLADRPTLKHVDCITARALAPLGKLLGFAAPLFAEDTKALFLKGRETEREIEEAATEWSFQARLHQSRTDPDGQIVEISNLSKLVA